MYRSIVLFLALIGLIALITILLVFLYTVYDSLRLTIHRLKVRAIVSHRFGKKPTAKCYCNDCIYWVEGSSRCYYFGDRNTARNWFWWNATPRRRIDDKKE